jgi:3-oxoacyl-(acyl-carrier-protein) synthase
MRGSHNSFSVADYVSRLFELAGPAVTVCTACSSSAKVFAAAQRMIAADQIDAAIVGGVDSLCLTTLYGFHSLQLTSPQPCRPFDLARDGLSIGEAAAFALLERAPATLDPEAILLLGAGESSDAYHMSSPHPEGPARAAPCSVRWPTPGWRRAMSTTSICTAPARRAMTAPRAARSPRCSAPPPPAAPPRAPPAMRSAPPARSRR